MVQYAVTFTIRPQHYCLEVDAQALILGNALTNVFDSKTFKRFFVFELTKNMNVHAHGIIETRKGVFVKSTVERMFHDKIRRNKIIGISEIKETFTHPKDPEKTWFDYCVKDIEKTQKEMPDIHPVFCDDYEYVHQYDHTYDDDCFEIGNK